MEYEVWSVPVAGYVLGYSLTMKSKNNDKTRVMIIITIITTTTMMSTPVVSTALIWGYRSIFGLLSEHVSKPPHMHRSSTGLGITRTVHNSLLHEGVK